MCVFDGSLFLLRVHSSSKWGKSMQIREAWRTEKNDEKGVGKNKQRLGFKEIKKKREEEEARGKMG